MSYISAAPYQCESTYWTLNRSTSDDNNTSSESSNVSDNVKNVANSYTQWIQDNIATGKKFIIIKSPSETNLRLIYKSLSVSVLDHHKEQTLAFHNLLEKARDALRFDPSVSLNLLSTIKISKWGKTLLKKHELSTLFEENYQQILQIFSNCLGFALKKPLARLTKPELLNHCKNNKISYQTACPNLARIAQITSNITYYFASKILSRDNLKDRVIEMENVISLANICFKQKNFMVAQALKNVMDQACIFNLSKTYESICPELKEQKEELDKFFEEQKRVTYRSDRQNMMASLIQKHFQNTVVVGLNPFLNPLKSIAEATSTLKDTKITCEDTKKHVMLQLENRDYYNDSLSKLRSQELELTQQLLLREKNLKIKYRSYDEREIQGIINSDLKTLNLGTQLDQTKCRIALLMEFSALSEEQLQNKSNELKQSLKDLEWRIEKNKEEIKDIIDRLLILAIEAKKNIKTKLKEVYAYEAFIHQISQWHELEKWDEDKSYERSLTLQPLLPSITSSSPSFKKVKSQNSFQILIHSNRQSASESS